MLNIFARKKKAILEFSDLTNPEELDEFALEICSDPSLLEDPVAIECQTYVNCKQSDPKRIMQIGDRILARVDLFSRLSGEQRAQIAAASSIRVFGNGETIVRQNEPGQSMFIVCSGAAIVLLEPDRREVAVIEAGGYFGEMSLLTGEPRSASVVARGDATVLELDADVFRTLGAADPRAVERIGLAAVTRRAELVQMRDSGQAAPAVEVPATFLGRMKKFLGL